MRNRSERVPQSMEELEKHLQHQLSFLKASSEAYDRGQSIEAKRLATTIRLLVHDGGSSDSLLGQLRLKSIAFIDGGDTPDPRNLMTTAGLTGMSIGVEGGSYIPKFALQPSYRPPTLRTFVEWWTRPVLVDDERTSLSRKDLVLAMANSDGGAHVDSSVERTYARLTRQNSIGWSFSNDQGSGPMLGIEYASVRQIAWELEQSIERKETIQFAPELLRGTGRNDPCPCGSEVKFKKCHGGTR